MCVCVCVFVCVCVCIYVERSCTTRISRGSARALSGSWQHRHASLHSHAALCTSTVTLTPTSRRPSSISRGVKQECSGLFRRGVPSATLMMCRPRGPPPASSSPLGAYSSPAAHRITPHNLTSLLDLPLSTYILVEQPPPQYAQRLDWVVEISGHHMRHASLTCAAGDTSGRSCRRIRACATPTCISRQT